MKLLRICGLDENHKNIYEHRMTHVLSLLDPGKKVDYSHHISVEDHKVLYFNDIQILGGSEPPTFEICSEILHWGRTVPHNANVLIHCHAGISRSTCSAFAIMCDRTIPKGISKETLREHIEVIGKMIYNIRPFMHPNMLMARYFDDILGYNGEFVEVCKNICYPPNGHLIYEENYIAPSTQE